MNLPFLVSYLGVYIFSDLSVHTLIFSICPLVTQLTLEIYCDTPPMAFVFFSPSEEGREGWHDMTNKVHDFTCFFGWQWEAAGSGIWRC